jgi:hypothetical protein
LAATGTVRSTCGGGGRHGLPLTGRNLDIEAIGDVGAYEPDGGVGLATETDGTFSIERLAEMGWGIIIRDPATGSELGRIHIRVRGGETTTVQIQVAA